MSDDLDLDMEVVEDDELDELGADGASSAGRHSRSEKESMSKEDSSRTENVSPSNSQSAGSESEDSKGDFERLGEFVEFINGNKPDRVFEKPSDDAEPYLTVETLRDGELKYAIDETAPRASPDDVLMIMDGSGSGRVYPGREGIISSTFSALKISQLCPEYVRYFLEHNFRRINSATKGSAVPHTDKDLVRSLEIPSVEIDEQHKIASVLYAVDQAIQKTEAIIDQARRVKRGLMQDVFRLGIDQSWSIRNPDADTEQWQKTPLGRIPRSWEHVRLGDVVERSGGLIQTGPFGSQLHQEEYVDEGVPVVMPQNIEDGKVDTAEIAQITPSKADELSRHRLRENDVVLARRGNLERAAVITEEENGWICGTGCLLIRLPVDEIAGSWFSAVYGYGIVQDQIKAQAVGSTMLNLNQSILENLQLALPPLREQERITSVLSRADAKIEEEVELKFELQDLKTGLMQDLLTGKVRTADKAIDVLDEVVEHG